MTKPRDLNAFRALAESLANNPLRFVSLCWPEMKLTPEQHEILLSVRDNLETFVHAANATGKTRIAAVVAIWFYVTRTPARVITSSSSESQLATILWSEIRQLIKTSKLHLPLVIHQLCIKKRLAAWERGASVFGPDDSVLQGSFLSWFR